MPACPQRLLVASMASREQHPGPHCTYEHASSALHELQACLAQLSRLRSITVTDRPLPGGEQAARGSTSASAAVEHLATFLTHHQQQHTAGAAPATAGPNIRAGAGHGLGQHQVQALPALQALDVSGPPAVAQLLLALAGQGSLAALTQLVVVMSGGTGQVGIC